MITPVTNDLLAPLPTDRNGQPDQQTLAVGQQPAAPAETLRATPPVEESSPGNNAADVTRGEQALQRESVANRSNDAVQNQDQARSTLTGILDQLRQLPSAAAQAQGNVNNDTVSSLLQTAPA